VDVRRTPGSQMSPCRPAKCGPPCLRAAAPPAARSVESRSMPSESNTASGMADGGHVPVPIRCDVAQTATSPAGTSAATPSRPSRRSRFRVGTSPSARPAGRPLRSGRCAAVVSVGGFPERARDCDGSCDMDRRIARTGRPDPLRRDGARERTARADTSDNASPVVSASFLNDPVGELRRHAGIASHRIETGQGGVDHAGGPRSGLPRRASRTGGAAGKHGRSGSEPTMPCRDGAELGARSRSAASPHRFAASPHGDLQCGPGHDTGLRPSGGRPGEAAGCGWWWRATRPPATPSPTASHCSPTTPTSAVDDRTGLHQ